MAATASASEAEPDYIAEYEAQYGERPDPADFPDPADHQAAYDVWFAGLEPYVIRRAAEYERQKAAAEEAAQEAAEAGPSVIAPETFESAGLNDEIPSDPSDPPVDTGDDDKYPVGSYVDAAGNVYSPSGTLLSPGTTPAVGPAASLSLAAIVSSALDTAETAPSEVEGPVYHLADLRPDTDLSASAPVGLKALIVSIFGEYTPVTTTSVVSESAGTEVNQYLVETVAPGAAGVDYEWIAGVFLFGILLYCLMKLLGGVLK